PHALVSHQRQPRPGPILLPYTTLFRSLDDGRLHRHEGAAVAFAGRDDADRTDRLRRPANRQPAFLQLADALERLAVGTRFDVSRDRKSTRLNSSHVSISYAVFCLKKES